MKKNRDPLAEWDHLPRKPKQEWDETEFLTTTTWESMSTGSMIATSIGAFLLLLALATNRTGFLFVLDHANLAFHEAGHLFFGILGSTMGLYGGTLGQLVFPTVTIVTFWKRRDPIGLTWGALWYFQNFLNISWYMADARAQQLPLVGGGDHDWTRIFSRWGVLAWDTRIAAITRWLGWFGMLAALSFLVWYWHKHREELD